MLSFIHKYPFSNFHELNLDWIISEMKKLREEFTGVDKLINDAVDYMKNNIYQTATEIINQAIEAGDINVGVTYDAPNEELNIIITR